MTGSERESDRRRQKETWKFSASDPGAKPGIWQPTVEMRTGIARKFC